MNRHSIGNAVSDRARPFVLRFREVLVKARLRHAVRRSARGVPRHTLSRELVVSLTSYPRRFETLPWTLSALIDQNMRPDRIVLWIAHEHLARLTAQIRAFEDCGVEIRGCADLASYKKIVPALEQFPDSFVVTADDDLYYPPWWLGELVHASRANPGQPVAHRVHRIALTAHGTPKAYREWTHCIKDRSTHPLNFATSGGGALYPPGSLHADVTRKEAFMRLCPTADDIWLYWMMRLAGGSIFNVGGRFRARTWLAAQSERSLYAENFLRGGNDRQIEAMRAEYGFGGGDAVPQPAARAAD